MERDPPVPEPEEDLTGTEPEPEDPRRSPEGLTWWTTLPEEEEEVLDLLCLCPIGSSFLSESIKSMEGETRISDSHGLLMSEDRTRGVETTWHVFIGVHLDQLNGVFLINFSFCIMCSKEKINKK